MKNGEVLETASSVYRILRQAGGGGSGKVYQVIDDSEVTWAAKVLDPNRATSSNKKRFKNEIGFAQKSNHPNIVRLVDHGLVNVGGRRTPFYIMPFYAGSLKQLIARGAPVPDTRRLFAQILDGVDAAHRLGAIHRDIKPANILHDENSSTLLVADFGIARFTEDLLATLIETDDRDRLANFEYAAPEQRRPGGVVDARSDIFALGLVLYEMLMGEVPHSIGAVPIASKHPHLAYLDPIVDAMRAQTPSSRPQSIAELKARLQLAGDQFVTQQKLSATTSAVVPVSEIDDHLVVDPIRIESITYDDGRLRFIFHKRANPQWFAAFQRINWNTAIGDATPSHFSFHTNGISVPCAVESSVRGVIAHVRDWIQQANDNYRAMLEREQRLRDDEAKKAIEAKRRQEEQRLRMLKAIETAG